MATLGALAKAGKEIVRIDVELDEGLPHRFLYGTPRFIDWIEKQLPKLKTGLMASDLEPYDQVFERFRQYIVGTQLRGDRRFAPLSCNPELWVWELKTTDVRIFGWVPKMDHFVCCFGCHADLVKEKKLYPAFIREVDRTRRDIDLDPPKAIEFKEYENVLSDAPRR